LFDDVRTAIGVDPRAYRRVDAAAREVEVPGDALASPVAFDRWVGSLAGTVATPAWSAPDGSKHPVYVLESRNRGAGARFPRVLSYVRQDNFVVVRAEIFSKRNELQKTFEAGRVEKVDGYWTVLEMKMADTVERTRTELVLEKVEYNIGLKPDDFSRRELERGSGGRP
jgi:hypothetical protein